MDYVVFNEEGSERLSEHATPWAASRAAASPSEPIIYRPKTDELWLKRIRDDQVEFMTNNGTALGAVVKVEGRWVARAGVEGVYINHYSSFDLAVRGLAYWLRCKHG